MVLEPDNAQTAGFLASFLTITSLFILFADLFPKRLGMAEPERLAMRLVKPMAWCMTLLRPVVWVYSRLTNALFQLFGLPSMRDDRITSDDILAIIEAGAEAGLLAAQEQQVIANVFELDTRTVESAMTSRERIVFFLQSRGRAGPHAHCLRAALDLPGLRWTHRPGGGLRRCHRPVPAGAAQRAHRTQGRGLARLAEEGADRAGPHHAVGDARRSSARRTRTSPSSSTSTAWWWASSRSTT